MASEYKGLYVKFEGDSTELSKALGKINSESRKAQSSLRSVQNAAKLDPKNTKLLGDAIAAAKDKAEALSKRVDVLRQAEQKLEKQSEDAKKKMQDLADAGEEDSDAYKQAKDAADGYAKQLETVKTRADTAESSLRAAQKALTDFSAADTPLGKAADKLDTLSQKADTLSGKLSSIGDGMTVGVTVPIVAGATAAVSSAIDVDTALTNVKKTTDLTADGYEQLKDSAIELSKTQPVSAEDILNIEALGAQLGWSNDQLEPFAQTVSGLDIATDMDAETAATQLAQFANITGMAQDKASNYASAIVDLGNNSATTESKISDMAQNMASAGTQAGMSQADILGIAAATSSLGMEAQAGGTAFSRTITDISEQVSTNGEHLQQWAELAGMSVDEFKQAWGEDATGTFEKVIQGMSDVESSGGDLNVTLDDLGITETRQSDFLRRLAGNSDLLTSSVDRSNQAWEDNTALGQEVDNRNDSIASKLQVLKNRVEAVATEVGGPLIDAASDALEAAEPLIESIEDGAKAFSDMSKDQQLAIIKAVAFAAAIGPVAKVLGTVTSGVGKLSSGASKALKALSKLQVGFTTTDTTVLEATKSTGGLAGKLGALGNPLTRATEGSSKFQRALSTLATGVDGVITMLPALAAGLAIGAVAEQGAEALMRLADGYDEARQKSEDSIQACNDWATAQQSVTGATVDASTAFADNGQSASTLKDTVSDAMSAITSTIETETQQWGGITADGVQAIQDQLAKINQAQVDTASAFGNAIDAATSKFDHLDSSNVTQYIADVDSAYDQGKQQLDDTLNQQLQLIEAYHQQVGDVGSEAYNNDVQAAKDAYSQSLSALDGYKSQAISSTSSMYGQLDQATVDGWRALEEDTQSLNNDFQKFLNDDNFGSSIAIQKTKDDFERIRSTIDEGTTGAWMAAQAATVSAGGQLDSASNDNIRIILDAFDDLPDSLQDEGTESMRALANAVEASGVDLGDVGSMSAQELVDKMREVFGQVPEDANATVDQITDAFASLNGIQLDPKYFTVTDDGTIQDSTGKVWDLNAMTIDGKHFTVNDDGTISIEGTAIQNVDAMTIATKYFDVTDSGSAWAAQNEVKSVDDESIDDKDFEITAEDHSTSVIDTIKQKLAGIGDKVIHIFTSSGNATGGVFGTPESLSAVRYHAEGFIADTPTYISSHDIVGEAGAEAVIPLTNRAYTKPFAATVADEVVGMLGGQQPTYVDNRRSITNNVYEREDAYVAADILTRRMLS